MRTTLNNFSLTIFKYKLEILLTLTVFTYALILSLRTMPFAEGWYTYYAECINNGETAYKDFDYLFTPFYIHLIALFTKIFGYKIILLRIFGAFIFSGIALCLYLTLKEVFDKKIAVVATIPAVMYQQSEVVQIFYDYIRVMDLFVCLTLLFLLKYIKSFRTNITLAQKYLFIAGIFNAIVILTKQNVGILILAYTFLLIIAASIACHYEIKKTSRLLLWFLLGSFIPIFFTVLLMISNDSLTAFFSQTGSEAIAAKGGVLAILFAWFYNNSISFGAGLNNAVYCLELLVVLIIIYYYCVHKETTPRKETTFNKYTPIIYLLFCLTSFVLMSQLKGFSFLFNKTQYLSPYTLFLIVTPIFLILILLTIKAFVKHEEVTTESLLLITITGAYFTISWSCGMSAGLAEGQASIGLAVIVAIVLKLLDTYSLRIGRYAVIFVCLLMSLQFGAKKMIYSYNWWGMSDADYWASNKQSSDIPLLKGLKLSPKTLNAYEKVYHIVRENTKPDDVIYCFPQIPIFYSLCERKDPGVRAKVQWFDVASDSSITNDIKVMKNNPPKVIVIYETSEFAYSSHERLFRSGKISATRRMKNFLISYAKNNGYKCSEKIEAEPGNALTVFYKKNN